jgi:hypothetical protein
MNEPPMYITKSVKVIGKGGRMIMYVMHVNTEREKRLSITHVKFNSTEAI